MIIHVDKPHRKISTLYQLSSTGPGYSLQKSSYYQQKSYRLLRKTKRIIYISESYARRFEASHYRNGSQLQRLQHNLRPIGSGKVSRTIYLIMAESLGIFAWRTVCENVVRHVCDLTIVANIKVLAHSQVLFVWELPRP